MPNTETTTLLREAMHELDAYGDEEEARAVRELVRQFLLTVPDLDDPAAPDVH